MDWRTAAEVVAVVVVAAWNVVAHIRVGRVKDQQIATMKSQVDQLKGQVEQVLLLTYKGANDQIAALDQLHKREMEILTRQHEIELEDARNDSLTAEQLATELAETKRKLDAISGEREAFMERRVEDFQRQVELAAIVSRHASIASRYPGVGKTDA